MKGLARPLAFLRCLLLWRQVVIALFIKPTQRLSLHRVRGQYPTSNPHSFNGYQRCRPFSLDYLEFGFDERAQLLVRGKQS